MHNFCRQFHWQCYKQKNPPKVGVFIHIYIYIYLPPLTIIIQCVEIESIFNKCMFKGAKKNLGTNIF
jgi:hypothetical protein